MTKKRIVFRELERPENVGCISGQTLRRRESVVSKNDLRPGISALDAGPRTGRERESPASEQSAHHAADQSDGAANTAVTVSPTAATTGRTVAFGFVASARIRR